MMKIFKGKEASSRERETTIADTATAAPDADSWFLFKFFDMNVRRWSPVYAAFSASVAHQEMMELVEKQPRRAFAMKGLGVITGANFEPVIHERVYIGGEYEDIG